jgi:hypothetical protein
MAESNGFEFMPVMARETYLAYKKYIDRRKSEAQDLRNKADEIDKEVEGMTHDMFVECVWSTLKIRQPFISTDIT